MEKKPALYQEKDEEGIRTAMKGYAPENETPPSMIDKTIDWVSGKLPGS